MQIFDEPRLYDQFGRGGSDGQWRTLTIYIYDLGWTQQNFGRASAVAWLLFLIIVILAVINLLLTRTISSSGNRDA
jgi:cellobiose transport system permease protein